MKNAMQFGATLLIFASGWTVAGCQQRSGPSGPSGRLALEVSPLSLPGITDVSYTVTVTNGLSQPVWNETISSAQYGDGRGSLTFVGTCDASPGAANTTVTLKIEKIFANNIELESDEWVDPGLMTQEVNCQENADTPVIFNVTVMRPARQGFFDIGVTFDNIFCSGKVDVCNGDQDPPTANDLLFNQGLRDTTVIMGLTCGTEAGGKQTLLYIGDLQIVCEGKAAIPFNPTEGPGTVPLPSAREIAATVNSVMFANATYWGLMTDSDRTMCYWNNAYGINAEIDATVTSPTEMPNCYLRGFATATYEPFKTVSGGFQPDTKEVYPKIVVNVPLTDSEGKLRCDGGPNNNGNYPLGYSETNGSQTEGMYVTYSTGTEQPVYDYFYGCNEDIQTGCYVFGEDSQELEPAIAVKTAYGFDIYRCPASQTFINSDCTRLQQVPLPANLTLQDCSLNAGP
jgi:hypothetical protein